MNNIKKMAQMFAAMFSMVVASTAMGVTDVNAASPDSVPAEDTGAEPGLSPDTGKPVDPSIVPGKESETPLFFCPLGCGLVDCGPGRYCVDTGFVSCDCFTR